MTNEMAETILKPLSPGVFGVIDPIVTVTRATVGQLAREAANVPLRRARLCAHHAPDDLLHEMLIVLANGTYIRPHRHFGKTESFHVIEGTCDLVLFDDTGAIHRVLELGSYESGLIFFYRLAEPMYHTVLISSDRFIVHETTNGPLRREDSEFAQWAPPADDPQAANDYMETLMRKVEGGRRTFKRNG
jgi:cupin fold WbuC family metalloprotein